MDHRFFELHDSDPLEGGNVRRRRLPVVDRNARMTAAQVDLVPDYDVRRCCRGAFQELRVHMAPDIAVIGNQEHEVRILHGPYGAFNSDSLHLIGRFPKPGRVVHVERNARNDDPFAYDITCRTRNVCHDCGVGASQAVEQARLSDVGGTRDHQLDTVAQHRASVGVGERCRDRVAHSHKPRRRFGCAEEIELLIRKINRRLDEGAQFDEGITMVLDRARELTGE